MPDNKQVGFEFKILGLSNEEIELQRVAANLNSIKQEIRDINKEVAKQGGIASREQLTSLANLNKELNLAQKNYKEITATVKGAEGSLTRMRAELSRLKQEYADGSSEIRQKLAPEINKLTDKVNTLEQAIGVHGRGVGNYKNSIIEAGKELLGFGGYVALAATALNKLKQAFQETEIGAKVTKQWTEGVKTFFQSIVKGDLVNATSNAAAAMQVAKIMDDIRKGDREDLIVIARLEGEIHQARLLSVSAAKSTAEQLQYTIQAEQKEKELIEFKLKDKKEELLAVQTMLVLRSDDTNLLNMEAQLKAEIINIENEQSLRLASKVSKLKEKEIEERKKANEEIIKGQKELQEEVDKYQKEQAEKTKKRLEEEIKLKKEAVEASWQWSVELGRSLFQQNQKDAEAAWKKLLEDDEKKKALAEKRKETIQAIEQAGIQGIQMGADAAFSARKSRLQAQMEAELTNENLTQSQRLDIQKKYAKEQQQIDIKQALINGALAIGNAFATAKPFFPAAIIGAALAALQTGIQVATIKAQKFATGGKIQGGLQIHPDTSKDNTLVYVQQGETILNQRQVAALGGSSAMRRIRVPGYADGGYIGQRAPEIGNVGFDYAAMARLMNSIEVRLDINKVNSAQREIQVITEPQRL